jgi:hypothetical protein
MPGKWWNAIVPHTPLETKKNRLVTNPSVDSIH